jgi:hypothetical protein
MEDAEIQRQHGKHENMKQHPKKPVRGHRWNCNNRPLPPRSAWTQNNQAGELDGSAYPFTGAILQKM